MGGLVLRRHHSLRDAFAAVGREAGYTAATEVYEPRWTRARVNEGGQWQLEQDAAQAALKAQLVAQDRLYAKKMEVMQQKLDGLESGAGTKADLDYIHELLVSKSDKGEVYRTIATLESKVGDASEALKSTEQAVQSDLQMHETRLESRLMQIQSQLDKYEERTASALSQQVMAERHLSEQVKKLADDVAEKADRQSVANALRRAQQQGGNWTQTYSNPVPPEASGLTEPSGREATQ